MEQRNKNINDIVNIVRDDLKNETLQALNLCTDEEIEGILDVKTTVRCLEIEYIFTKMTIQNRIKETYVPGWAIRNNIIYDDIKERYLPGVRNDKIDKLID